MKKLVLILSLFLVSCSITKVFTPNAKKPTVITTKSTEERVEEFFKEQDHNKDGFIDIEEFSEHRKSKRNNMPTLAIIIIISAVFIISIWPKIFDFFQKLTNAKFRKK